MPRPEIALAVILPLLGAGAARAEDSPANRLKAVEHTWEDESIVVQTSELDAEQKAILDALRIRLTNPVLKVSRVTAA